MPNSLHLVTLGVTDLARSRAFYAAVFGWPVSSSSQDDVVFFTAGGVVVGLYPTDKLADDARLPRRGGSGFGGITLAHNVTVKDDVAALLAKAQAEGATITKPAEDAFWGGHHGYFADPDGHPWEIAWNPFFPFNDDGTLRLP